PDMGSGHREMAWIYDEYRKYSEVARGVVTGKPLEIGGSAGRKEATGRGVVCTMAAAVRQLGMKDCTVAIQGFGNVGSYAALELAERGITVIAVGDARGNISNKSGLNIKELFTYYESNGTVVGFPGGEVLADVLTVQCDILIPCALDSVITAKNAHQIKAKLVIEGANGPTDPEADLILQSRGVFVVPDILANAGGVIVSYYEWVQNREGFYWSLKQVNDLLYEKLEASYVRVADMAKQRNVSMRRAAYCLALEKITNGMILRGVQ
ncbi:MAG: Glu/Leu/Phe/Val dehydrogenase, partial [Planctomycetota bacterium]